MSETDVLRAREIARKITDEFMNAGRWDPTDDTMQADRLRLMKDGKYLAGWTRPALTNFIAMILTDYV